MESCSQDRACSVCFLLQKHFCSPREALRVRESLPDPQQKSLRNRGFSNRATLPCLGPVVTSHCHGWWGRDAPGPWSGDTRTDGPETRGVVLPRVLRCWPGEPLVKPQETVCLSIYIISLIYYLFVSYICMYLSSNHLCVHLTTIHLSVYLPSYLSIHLLSLLCSRSAMSDSATPWTVACQTPLSMGFSRHESWSGSPWPPPGDLPDPGIKPASPTLAGGCLTPKPLREEISAGSL